MDFQKLADERNFKETLGSVQYEKKQGALRLVDHT